MTSGISDIVDELGAVIRSYDLVRLDFLFIQKASLIYLLDHNSRCTVYQYARLQPLSCEAEAGRHGGAGARRAEISGRRGERLTAFTIMSHSASPRPPVLGLHNSE